MDSFARTLPLACGFPRNDGGSAPALFFSRPAQRSLLLQPAYLPGRLKRPSSSEASVASLPPPLLRLLPGGANQFPGGTSPAVDQRLSRRTQVSQQCNRTGPPHSEETRVAGEGVWFLSDRVADTTGNRNSTHDSEGPSEVVGKRGCGGPRSLHRLAVRPRCLTGFDNSQLCSDTNRFSKNFATKPLIVNMRLEQLTDWATFDEVRQRLRHVSLQFQLDR